MFKSNKQRAFLFASDKDKQKGQNPLALAQQKSSNSSINPSGISIESLDQAPMNMLPQSLNKLKMPKLPGQKFLKVKNLIKK